MRNESFQPNRIQDYFRAEWKTLAAVTVSGLIYNVGLLLGPWFEGQMAGTLAEILSKASGFQKMLRLAIGYMLAILTVQGARYVKRLYVRNFANNVNRAMKRILFGNLVRKSRAELEREGAGNMLTKAIQDVDACAEGMRKFTTEVFDTGIALLAYAAMLLKYDFRLALMAMVFPPISYFLAEKMKGVVQKTGAKEKEMAGTLNAETLDRAENAVTYRIFGRESDRTEAYEKVLTDYERAAVKSNLFTSVLPPIYRVISMAGALPILWFGAKNVLGTGWTAWDIAAFTTFLSGFAKLAKKSSGAAKLFNAVHKAQVSWKRIAPLMQKVEPLPETVAKEPQTLTVENVSFAYPDGKEILKDVNFTLRPGQILGVTGEVACGKSTLGKLFLGEYPYAGSIRFGDKEISTMNREERVGTFGYLGHAPELFNESIQENILLGENGDAEKCLQMVKMDREVVQMENGIQTNVGNFGIRLSGGQAQRLALARTIQFKKPVLILDDPFSALDRQTEKQIFENLREITRDCAVILISHRLYLFDELDQVLYLQNGRAQTGTHAEMLRKSTEYAKRFSGGGKTA